VAGSTRLCAEAFVGTVGMAALLGASAPVAVPFRGPFGLCALGGGGNLQVGSQRHQTGHPLSPRIADGVATVLLIRGSAQHNSSYETLSGQ